VILVGDRTPRSPAGFAVGTTKTEESERTIRVRQELLERLDLSGRYAFMNEDREPVKGDSFRTNQWLLAMERTGLPPHRQPRIHDLRHTHASWQLDVGISLPAIQKRLGHGDVMTTLRVLGRVS
jgi:integrase